MTALFDTRYYYLTKLTCSMTGLWPYQSQFKKRILQLLNGFILLSFLPPQLKRLYHVYDNDLDATIMCITPIFTIVLNIAKNLTIIRFQSEIRSLLCQIEAKWEATLSTEENKILTTYASKTAEFCLIYVALLSNVLMCYILAPTVAPVLDIVLPRNETRVRYLAFELDYEVDLQTYWFWLWVHTSITGVVVALNYIAADTMYITLMFHGCYMFAIVRHKSTQVSHSVKKSTAPPFENHDYNTEHNTWRCKELQLELQEQATAVKQYILSHKEAIELISCISSLLIRCAQILYHIFTWSLFAGASINLIIISLSAVQLVSKFFQWTEMAMACMYVLGELMHLFFLTLMAQFILDHSLEVHESAYSCSWYKMPAKIQKDIIVILVRSRLPCKMMAGKLFVMSLESYCAIIQTSMSYFTVLASFR